IVICRSVGGMVAAAGALEMTGGQRVELEGLARSHTAPAREVRQAKALLWATDGVSNGEIARRCASTPKSVRRWRSRFAVREPLRWGASGRGVAALLCSATMLWKRSCMTRCTRCPRTALRAGRRGRWRPGYGIGKDTVARIWQARRIRPWEVETFKLSTDPILTER